MPKMRDNIPPIVLEKKMAQMFPGYQQVLEDVLATTGKKLGQLSNEWVLTNYADRINLIKSREAISYAVVLQAIVLWKQSRVVYEYDKTLSEILAQQEVPVIPVEALERLPHYCTCILNPPEPDVVAVYCFREEGPGRKSPQMAFVYQYKDERTKVEVLNLKAGKTIEECCRETLRTAIKEAVKYQAETGVKIRPRRPDIDRITRTINLLLYLVSDNTEVESDRPTPLRVPTPDNPDVKEPAKRPSTFTVGVRVGAAIRKARESVEQQKADNEILRQQGKRASPVPHVRRAHYARYWVGPNRDQLIIHWLEPVLVGVRSMDNVSTTIRPVKEWRTRNNEKTPVVKQDT